MSKIGENIYKRKDGRWEGRYVRSYDVDGKAKFGYVYGKTYCEVKQLLVEMKMPFCITQLSQIIVQSLIPSCLLHGLIHPKSTQKNRLTHGTLI